MPDPTRQDDETLLRVLALYRDGWSDLAIARRLGLTRHKVTHARRAVIIEDCAADPLAAHYWNPT